MNKELDNVFAKGTQAFQVAEKTILKPVNEDAVFVGKVTQVIEGAATVNKIWDAGTTKRDFVIDLAYVGKEGTPGTNDLAIDSYLPCYRCPGDSYRGFVKNSDLSSTGIAAFLSGQESFTKEDFAGVVYCGILGKTWKKTDLLLVSAYSVIKRTFPAFSVSGTNANKVFIDNAITLVASRSVVPGCTGSETGKVFPAQILPGVWSHDGTKEDCYCVIGQSTLAAGYLCCNELPPPPGYCTDGSVICNNATYPVLRLGYRTETALISRVSYWGEVPVNWLEPYHLWECDNGFFTPQDPVGIPSEIPIASRIKVAYIDLAYEAKYFPPWIPDLFWVRFWEKSSPGPKVIIKVFFWSYDAGPRWFLANIPFEIETQHYPDGGIPTIFPGVYRRVSIKRDNGTTDDCWAEPALLWWNYLYFNTLKWWVPEDFGEQPYTDYVALCNLIGEQITVQDCFCYHATQWKK